MPSRCCARSARWNTVDSLVPDVSQVEAGDLSTRVQTTSGVTRRAAEDCCFAKRLQYSQESGRMMQSAALGCPKVVFLVCATNKEIRQKGK